MYAGFLVGLKLFCHTGQVYAKQTSVQMLMLYEGFTGFLITVP